MANKAIKYRIYPTTEQSIMFSNTFGIVVGFDDVKACAEF